LPGIADKRDVGPELVAMGAKKRGEARTPGLFLAVDEHADVDGKLPVLEEPGAGCLDEGHQLAFVVGRPAGDDDRAVAWILDQTRIERRRAPFLQRVGRLDVVMAVEQHVPARLGRGRRAPMPNHHRLAQSRLDPRLEADLAQGAGASFSRGNAGLVKSGIGRDARNGEQAEQPLEGRRLFACEPVEHALQRAT
jgi:hypothetical protein